MRYGLSFKTPLKINAIKEIRNITGLGLKEAKDFVELADERQVIFDADPTKLVKILAIMPTLKLTEMTFTAYASDESYIVLAQYGKNVRITGHSGNGNSIANMLDDSYQHDYAERLANGGLYLRVNATQLRILHGAKALGEIHVTIDDQPNYAIPDLDYSI